MGRALSVCVVPFLGWLTVAACGSTSGSTPSGDAGADAHVISKTDSGSTNDSGGTTYDSDPHNCGAAGHDCTVCGGSTCTAGECVPTTLASAQSQPYAIAVDTTSVYWTNLGTSDDGSVVSANLDGSNLKVLVPPPVLTWGLAIDTTDIFFAATSAMRIGKNGTGLTTVGPAPAADEIAVDGTRVYWSGGGASAGKIQAADANGDGGELTYVLADLQKTPDGITFDATSIYWVNSGDGSVWMATKTATDTSTTHVIYQPSPPNVGGTPQDSIVVDDSKIFWSDLENIQSMNKDGSGRTTLVTGDARAVIADVDAIYFAPVVNSESTIRRQPKNGEASTTYDTAGTWPQQLAVDNNCVYWTGNPVAGGSAGTVQRLTK